MTLVLVPIILLIAAINCEIEYVCIISYYIFNRIIEALHYLKCISISNFFCKCYKQIKLKPICVTTDHIWGNNYKVDKDYAV